MKAKTKQIVVAELIEDFSLYPRHHVDDTHISDLVRALQAGVELPPIIAERKSLRIVDGWHRVRAHRKVSGDDATVVVELRDYKTEAELFLDAVALNASHGRKLDRHDQTRIVLRLRELHVSDQQIAIHLHVVEPIITQLALRVVKNTAGEAVPLKRGLNHLRGETLTDQQLLVMASVRSAELGRLTRELTRLLTTGLVNLADPKVVEQLQILHTAIEEALKMVAA